MSQELSAVGRDERAPGGSRRVTITAACRRCRQKKQRCNGERPSCSNCIRSAVPCDYQGIATNETRGHAARRQKDALRSQLDEISTSLDLLKAMSQEDAVHWLSVLRSAADPLGVLKSIRDVGTISPVLPGPTPSSSTIYSAPSPLRTDLDYALAMEHPTLYPLFPVDNVALNAASAPSFAGDFSQSFEGPAFGSTGLSEFFFNEAIGPTPPQPLCDDRLKALDISYWSPVPISNDLAARLISLFLVTDHPLHSPFDADLFIDNLSRRVLQFCSPLLVNAILFWACHTYRAVEPKAAQYASLFREAALRLLRAEEHNTSIMTISSLFCLTVGLICSGRDAAAKDTLRKYLGMAVTMRLHGENRAGPDELGLFAPDWISAFSYVAWSSYNFCCIYISHYRVGDWMKFVCKPPLLPIPGAEIVEGVYSTIHPAPMFMGQTFAQYCNLLPINQAIMSVYLDEESSPTNTVPLAFAEEQYRKLLEWADQLPPSLMVSSFMPHHAAVLHVSFHSMVMELFRPFLGRHLRLSRFPCPNTPPEEVFITSSNRIVEIFRLYYSTFRESSPLHTVTWLVAPVYTAHISLKGHPETLERRKVDFELCANALMALGVVLPMKESIVRGILGMGVSGGLLSPKESRQMLARVLEGERGKSAAQAASGTTLMIDFDRAVADPAQSSVDAFTKMYKDWEGTE